jgi:hypothetical protein
MNSKTQQQHRHFQKEDRVKSLEQLTLSPDFCLTQ